MRRMLYRISDPPRPLRLTVQITLAALLAYPLARVAGVDAGWAVISAIFVVEGTVGGTFTIAVTRVLGALIGLGTGLAFIFIIGTGEWLTLATLAASIGVMSLLAAWRPQLSYGLVTAAILTVGPPFDAVDSAFLNALAIAVGAITGVAVALLAFPRWARRVASSYIHQALRGCGDLVRHSVADLLDEQVELPDRKAIHAGIGENLRSARRQSNDAHLNLVHTGRTSPRDATAAAVERFWYALAMLDRVAEDGPLPDAARDVLGSHITTVARQVGSSIDGLCDTLETDGAPDWPADLGAATTRFAEAADPVRFGNWAERLTPSERGRLASLSFAFREVALGLEEVAGALGARRDAADGERSGAALAA